ncbi:hypothetical protein F4811DRAFT_552205 [Daldinia bambusicola]|nr:hypothetical protein F4811DRAFT_552205 [Daldinia bambusicola]
MDCNEELTPEQAEKLQAQKTLREARIRLYPMLTPRRSLVIESRTRKQPSSDYDITPSISPTALPTQTSQSGNPVNEEPGSKTPPSSAEMPPRRLSPSLQELSRTRSEPVERSFPRREELMHRDYEARFVAAAKALEIVATPVVDFWLEHDRIPLRLKKDPILLLILETRDGSREGDIIKSCAKVVIQHFSFQRRFSEIRYLIKDETQVRKEVYIPHLSMLAEKMYWEARMFFCYIDKNLNRYRAQNEGLYHVHRRWNQNRVKLGHGKYPGLARGLPSPLRLELQIDDPDADQSPSSTDWSSDDSSPKDLPEDWGAKDLEDVDW